MIYQESYDFSMLIPVEILIYSRRNNLFYGQNLINQSKNTILKNKRNKKLYNRTFLEQLIID